MVNASPPVDVEPDDGLLEDLLALVDEELTEIDVQRRIEEGEADRLIREELRMLSRQSTAPDIMERGQRLEKLAKSRASRQVNRADMHSDIARRKRLASEGAVLSKEMELVL